MSDQLFAHKARWYAQHASSPSWLYLFSRQQPADPFAGATHGGEVAFVLGHAISEPHSPEDDLLSDSIQRYWAAFAQHGDPNIGHDLPAWPSYSVEEPRLMTLDHVCAATPVVRAPLLDIHDIWLRRTCENLPLVRGSVAKL